MGWRSWNAFGNRITQDMMLAAADAIVAKNRTVAGHPSPVSLCDLGYCSVGVDVRTQIFAAPKVVGGTSPASPLTARGPRACACCLLLAE